jgi:hypothetical protein
MPAMSRPFFAPESKSGNSFPIKRSASCSLRIFFGRVYISANPIHPHSHQKQSGASAKSQMRPDCFAALRRWPEQSGIF